MASPTNDLDLFVDDAYLLALINNEPLPISDEKYAQELSLQEALYSSSSNPSITPQKISYFALVAAPTPKTEDNKHYCNIETGESSQTKTMFCNICMDFKQNPEIFEGLTKCNHDFCTDCIMKYVASKINENIALVECPDPKCRQVIEPETCTAILPKNVFERWETALFEAMIPGYQKFYCPYKDCSVFMVDDGGIEVRSSECPSCKRLFCAKCQVKWHQGVTCEEYETLREDEKEIDDLMVFKLAKDKKWRRCPSCRMFVEKIEGCHHMSCRCRHEFCYQCGGKWSDHQPNC